MEMREAVVRIVLIAGAVLVAPGCSAPGSGEARTPDVSAWDLFGGVTKTWRVSMASSAFRRLEGRWPATAAELSDFLSRAEKASGKPLPPDFRFDSSEFRSLSFDLQPDGSLKIRYVLEPPEKGQGTLTVSVEEERKGEQPRGVPKAATGPTSRISSTVSFLRLS